jgi:hypothetical protein
MISTTTKPDSSQPAAEMAVVLFDNWFDPLETEVRARAREFIEEMIRGELGNVLARPQAARLFLFRGRTRSALGGQAADRRRGPPHGGELRQAAGAAAANIGIKHKSSIPECRGWVSVQRHAEVWAR